MAGKMNLRRFLYGYVCSEPRTVEPSPSRSTEERLSSLESRVSKLTELLHDANQLIGKAVELQTLLMGQLSAVQKEQSELANRLEDYAEDEDAADWWKHGPSADYGEPPG